MKAEPRRLYRGNNQPSVLVVPESMTSAVSLYRAMGPLAALRRSHQVTIGITNSVNWATMAMHDMVLIQRAHTADHAVIAEIARLEGRPVWLDYDDDLFAIPTDNPSFRQYMTDTTRLRIAKMAARAAVITVSTRALAERFTPLNSNVVIIQNAFNQDLFGELASKPSPLKHCLWRGSKTHERDLLVHGPEITNAIKTHPDWTFTFVGYNPWFITEHCGDNVKIVPELDPLDYFTFLRASAPAVVFVPLHDSRFNRAKSNIGWQEATFAGAATVAPDMPEWRQPGVLNYTSGNAQDFGRKLNLLLDNADERAADWRASADTIQDGYMLDELNKLRAAVVEDLWGKALDPAWRQRARTDQHDDVQAAATSA